MLVGEIMRKDVYSVLPEAAVQSVAQLMLEAEVGTVLVARDRRGLGIVTDRDLATRILATGCPFRTPVEQVMSHPLIVCEATDDVGEALRLMRLHELRRLPVNEEGRLTGILSICDIATKGPLESEVEMTFADLCGRVTVHSRRRSEERERIGRHF